MLTNQAATRPKGVLFLCRDNGARSLMAEAILNAFAGGGMRAFSAGVEPCPEISMPVAQVIESHGVAIGTLKPKPSTEFEGFEGRKLDFVISICDPEGGEACPYWLGQPPRAQWHIAEPRLQANVNEYYRLLDESYELIFRCVNGFLNLPLEVMEKFALERRVGRRGARSARRGASRPAHEPVAS